jgi:uncharacterized protein (DUF433 family)
MFFRKAGDGDGAGNTGGGLPAGLPGQEIWNNGGQRIAMAKYEKIDWSECSLVEIKAGVQSGAPVLRGTRMPVDAIADNFDYGLSVEEIAEQFEIPADRVEAILNYAKSHRVAHRI